MRLYLIAIVITLTATYVIVNGCIFHASSARAVSITYLSIYIN